MKGNDGINDYHESESTDLLLCHLNNIAMVADKRTGIICDLIVTNNKLVLLPYESFRLSDTESSSIGIHTIAGFLIGDIGGAMVGYLIDDFSSAFSKKTKAVSEDEAIFTAFKYRDEDELNNLSLDMRIAKRNGICFAKADIPDVTRKDNLITLTVTNGDKILFVEHDLNKARIISKILKQWVHGNPMSLKVPEKLEQEPDSKSEPISFYHASESTDLLLCHLEDIAMVADKRTGIMCDLIGTNNKLVLLPYESFRLSDTDSSSLGIYTTEGFLIGDIGGAMVGYLIDDFSSAFSKKAVSKEEALGKAFKYRDEDELNNLSLDMRIAKRNGICFAKANIPNVTRKENLITLPVTNGNKILFIGHNLNEARNLSKILKQWVHGY
jgi:hypothetical protein